MSGTLCTSDSIIRWPSHKIRESVETYTVRLQAADDAATFRLAFTGEELLNGFDEADAAVVDVVVIADPSSTTIAGAGNCTCDDDEP